MLTQGNAVLVTEHLLSPRASLEAPAGFLRYCAQRLLEGLAHHTNAVADDLDLRVSTRVPARS